MKTIAKIGAVILSDDKEKMLVVRKKGRDSFIIPGGRPEGDEVDPQTLTRELMEELQLTVVSSTFFGDYTEPAEYEDAELKMRVYEVKVDGTPAVDNEIVEMKWIDRTYHDAGLSIGSTLRNHVVPALVSRGNL